MANAYIIMPPRGSVLPDFGILLKLMKNNKFSAIAPLYENQEVINDSGEKDRIFNTHFASKSNLIGNNDDPPSLLKKDYPELFILNTSPLEVAKLIRSCKVFTAHS